MNGSYLKRTLFHKIIGTISLIMIGTSMSILAMKQCNEAVVVEDDAKHLMQDQEKIDSYVLTFYYKLHILHVFSIICAFLIVLLSFIDLVPKHNVDVKYAFHFVSIFTIFCISLATIYGSFVAFGSPCMADQSSICCTIKLTPSLLSGGDAKTLTVFSANDSSMIAVMLLDLAAGIMQLLVALLYFRDVRNDAEQCGYLYRVHNEGYIIR